MAKQCRPGVIHSVNPITSISRHRAVTADGAQVSVAGGTFIGLSQKDGAVGSFAVAVVISGTAIAEAAVAFAKNTLLISDNQGRLTPAPAMSIAAGGVAVTSAVANGANALAGGATPQYVGCIALEAALAAGDFVEVKVL